jgi:aspartate 1-decarboxylase
MQRKLLTSKLHRATVTRCDLDYVGSVTIDAELLHASGLRPNEAVWVLDLDNGQRFETYIILGDPGRGEIGINGAAAHLTEVGHRVIILAYGLFDPDEIDDHVATSVIVDEHNRVEQILRYPSRLEAAQPTSQ